MPDYTPNFAGVIDALKTIIQNGIAGGSGGGGGGSGASAAEVKTAIEQASNLDTVETKLSDVNSNLGHAGDNAAANDDGSYNLIQFIKRLLSVKLGEYVTGTTATIPAGGIGILGLLSWIAKLISDRLPPARNFTYAALISRTASGDLTVISAASGQRIKVYSLIVKLKGTSENIVLIKDNATTIDQHLLIVRGDQSGFIAEIPIYRLSVNSPLVLNFSSNAEVIVSNILYEYEIV